jgi:hypothetical protein
MFSIFVVELQNYIIVFTVPNTLDVCDPENHTGGILFKQNKCYLTKRKENNPISIMPCDVSSQLLRVHNVSLFDAFCLDTR